MTGDQKLRAIAIIACVVVYAAMVIAAASNGAFR